MTGETVGKNLPLQEPPRGPEDRESPRPGAQQAQDPSLPSQGREAQEDNFLCETSQVATGRSTEGPETGANQKEIQEDPGAQVVINKKDEAPQEPNQAAAMAEPELPLQERSPQQPTGG